MRYFFVPTLFTLSLQRTSRLIFDACYQLDVADNPSQFDALLRSNQILRGCLAETILNSLHLELRHTGKCRNPDRRSFYYFVATLHPNVRQLIAQLCVFPIRDWSYMLVNFGQHLIKLDLQLGCTDAILELIPRCCPVLQYLNAEGRIERIDGTFNALTLDYTSVTDRGIAWLSGCKHLRVLKLLQPRSSRCQSRRRRTASLTHAGLRKLLRDVPTLTFLNCYALGSVLATDMEDVPELNLRRLVQLNVTPNDLQATFRLCRKLYHLDLTFFSDSMWNQAKVAEAFEHFPPTIESLCLKNIFLDTQLHTFFRLVSANLTCLSLHNSFASGQYTFKDLVLIGQSCSKLITLSLNYMTMTADEVGGDTVNVGQFLKLQHVLIEGKDFCIKKVLTFCAQNTAELSAVKMCDKNCVIRVLNDHIFDCVNMQNIDILSISGKFELSLNGIQRLAQLYPTLRILSVFCNEPNEEVIDTIFKAQGGQSYSKPCVY